MGATPSWLPKFLRILLNEEDMNVIIVDWNYGATTFIYNRAVKNTKKVAESLSRSILNILVSVEILLIIHAIQYTVYHVVPQNGSKINTFFNKHLDLLL
jgi:uncharacterized membrane protein